jgi:small subunit ribosomal protein S16
MLAIRMQRTGRKGHTQFRVIVQESRLNPSSGRVVAQLGSYNPHTKEALLDIEKASTFLNNGAQPSSRVALLLQKQGVKLPDWVKIDSSKTHAIKNTEKLRRNQPAKEVVAEVEVAPVAEEPAEEATLAE